MASFLRATAHQGRLLTQAFAKRSKTNTCACFISTSKKKEDISIPVEQVADKNALQKQLEKHFADTDPNLDKNAICYGFNYYDKDDDKFRYNMTMFAIISIAFCWGALVVSYFPDHRHRDWVQLEGYLELERREKLGLPLIDPDYTQADTITLPAEEELGDVEILL